MEWYGMYRMWKLQLYLSGKTSVSTVYQDYEKTYYSREKKEQLERGEDL